MTRREELEQHSKDELIDYILALEQRIADIEARLNQPHKTSRNSSRAPSQDEEPNKARKRKAGKTGKGGQGQARSLEPNPDRTVTAPASNCPSCGGHVGPAHQTLKTRYDRIEIPPVRPDVTRVHQYQGECPCCGERFAATPPEGLEPGSPFGRSVEEAVIYLHTIHAISYQRLSALMLDMFGVSISEGTIANILSRAKEQVDAAVADITAELRKAGVIGCDETGARVAGQKYWQWVFGCATAVLHKVAPSRGKAVVREVLGEHVPAVWVSDRFAAQTGHGESRQLCLAHLLRDAQYAIDAGDTVFAPPLKDLLLRAVDIARRREDLQKSTLYQYRCRLDRELDDLVTRPSDSHAGEKLRGQIRRVRCELFVCVTNPGVPATNNASERYLRPAVIFRNYAEPTIMRSVDRKRANQGEIGAGQLRITRARMTPGTAGAAGEKPHYAPVAVLSAGANGGRAMAQLSGVQRLSFAPAPPVLDPQNVERCERAAADLQKDSRPSDYAE